MFYTGHNTLSYGKLNWRAELAPYFSRILFLLNSKVRKTQISLQLQALSFPKSLVVVTQGMGRMKEIWETVWKKNKFFLVPCENPKQSPGRGKEKEGLRAFWCPVPEGECEARVQTLPMHRTDLKPWGHHWAHIQGFRAMDHEEMVWWVVCDKVRY